MKRIRVNNLQRQQHGVVLIVAIVMLILISMLTIFALREANNAEVISNNVRTRELANQAAEFALSYCEDALQQIVSGPVTFSAIPSIQPYTNQPLGNNLSNWDTTRTGVFVLSLTLINRTTTSVTYKRAPECIIEVSPLANVDTTANTNKAYLVTARGFGPDVAAGTTVPTGSEVWLQSSVEF